MAIHESAVPLELNTPPGKCLFAPLKTPNEALDLISHAFLRHQRHPARTNDSLNFRLITFGPLQTPATKETSLSVLFPTSVRLNLMSSARYVHWQDQGMWLGYFEEFPDYLSQGETLAELQDNLRDLYRDLTSGELPGIRRVADLTLG